MPSQRQGITLEHSPDGSGYRLLELPPDLANLLESQTAPVSVPSRIQCPSTHFLPRPVPQKMRNLNNAGEDHNANFHQTIYTISNVFSRGNLCLPLTSSLTLESSDTSAILRTPDRTYTLRQKNTSNALCLLSTRQSADSTEPHVAIVATVHETVDLDPVHEPPGRGDGLIDTGSRGKWHERFGKGR